MGGSVYWRVSRGGGRARGGGVAGKQSCLSEWRGVYSVLKVIF